MLWLKKNKYRKIHKILNSSRLLCEIEHDLTSLCINDKHKDNLSEWLKTEGYRWFNKKVLSAVIEVASTYKVDGIRDFMIEAVLSDESDDLVVSVSVQRSRLFKFLYKNDPLESLWCALKNKIKHWEKEDIVKAEQVIITAPYFAQDETASFLISYFDSEVKNFVSASVLACINWVNGSCGTSYGECIKPSIYI